MARSSRSIGIVFCVLAAQHVAAQDVLGKMLASDALWSGVKKDAIHSHLQRMLQIDVEHEELASLETCSPAALTQDKKCVAAQPTTDSKPAPKSSVAVPNCKGPDCLVAPMPGGDKVATSSEPQAPAAPQQKLVTYGPMTQDAFERMVHRKRAALRAELQKAGSLTAELDAFLRTSNGPLTDAFGIPMPAGPKEARPRADFEMRFAPQTPSPDPAITSTTTITSGAAATTTTTTTTAPRDDFEMRFEPQTPAPDPRLIRNELEAFIAASPALNSHHSVQARAVTSRSSLSSEAAKRQEEPKTELQTKKPEQLQEQQPKQEAATQENVSVPRGPTHPPMTEQEAARLAAQQAANTAAREAALARKRQMVRGELQASTSADMKLKLNSTASTSAATNTTTSVPRLPAEQRRIPSRNTTTANVMPKVKRAAAATPTSSSWGVFGYMFIALLLAASAVGLFAVAAVLGDSLLDGPSGADDWLALTRGLWRRCRRAFSAARKQLTGHGSDLPLSAHEGAGPLARAFAAAAAFVHIFWTHLVDSRGQHLAGAVTAAIDASRRASAGGIGAALPGHASSGGADAVGSWAQSHPQPLHGAGAAAECVIEADTSAAVTAAAELSLRRRH